MAARNMSAGFVRCWCNRAPLALGLLLCVLAAAQAQQKGVSVSLRARWNATSYVLEAGEFLADESPKLYWDYVDAWMKGPSHQEADCWKTILATANTSLTLGMSKVMQVVLAIRQYSAKLEMYHQLARQQAPEGQCCWVEVGGRTVNDARQLGSTLSQLEALNAAQFEAAANATETYEFDHVHTPATPGKVALPAVLYGAPGTQCFKSFHRALTMAAARVGSKAGRQLLFIHRPVLLPACKAEQHSCLALGSGEQLALPGYGVELSLKNTEYSAMDDKQKEPPAAPSGNTGQADGELGTVNGFDFDTLVARKPHLRQELLTFKDTLEYADDNEALKVWDLHDLGLQATQRIMSAADPLALLTELAQNFPSLVSSLSRQAVDGDLRDAVEANQQVVGSAGTYVLLNGMHLDLQDSVDLYGLVDRIRGEVRLRETLSALGLTGRAADDVLAARAQDKTDQLSELRLELHPLDHVTWLNNLEKDAMYRRFSSSLQELLTIYPGRLKPMARNVFTAIYIVDPLTPSALNVPNLALQAYQGLYPVRFGVLPLVPEVVERQAARRRNPRAAAATPAWDDMALRERATRALLLLKACYGGLPAFMFWQHLSQSAAITADDIHEAFKAGWAAGVRSPGSAKGRIAAKKPAEQAWQDLQDGTGLAAEVGMQLQELTDYMVDKGLTGLAGNHLYLNGALSAMGAAPDQELMYKVAHETQLLQEYVYYGKLNDGASDVLAALLRLSGTIKRWNADILAPSAAASQQVALQPALVADAARFLTYLHHPGSEGAVKAVTHWVVADVNTPQGRALLLEALKFLREGVGGQHARVSIVPNPADLSALPSGLEMMLVACGSAAPPHKLPAFLEALLKAEGLVERLAAAGNKKRDDIEAALELAEGAGLLPLGGAVYDVMATGFPDHRTLDSKSLLARWRSGLAGWAREHVHLGPGVSAVVTNGRRLIVHDPLAATESPLLAADFSLLTIVAKDYQPGAAIAHVVKRTLRAFQRAAEADPEEQGVAGEEEEGDGAGEEEAAKQKQAVDRRDLEVASSRVAAATAAVLGGWRAGSGGTGVSQQLREAVAQLEGHALQVGAAAGQERLLDIVAVLDPLSRSAQRLGQLLGWLAEALPMIVQLHLNPQREITKMPLSTFYRFSLPELSFADGVLTRPPSSPTAYFPRLPGRRVLTMNPEVPEAWLVEPVNALHDLDNLRLADVPEPVTFAEFELEALIMTGTCLDATTSRMSPPRGLQLWLGTPADAHVSDTLVMSNLGYFQLKAGPGLWTLGLAPGRSSDLFHIRSAAGVTSDEERDAAISGVGLAASRGDGHVVDAKAQLIISSFTGKDVVLKVRKHPGKEEDKLLEVGDGEGVEAGAPQEGGNGGGGGIWGSVASMFGGAGKGEAASQAAAVAEPVVNVFTVASGHMYERLQRIMFLSVVKNTKARVKFWIIKNYMSPHHKATLPAMAAHYGFDYEFVTYKWPHWLHKQTEKQRLIWAYKILFLDVLFPLSVDRIIFVDSDQVVRGDLAELFNMDLKGAPMAFTPFCDNNKEMDEFRFWKGGFWKDHLQGKPYHISALFIVDIRRMRQMAAGDQYRVVYEQLSKDPNSLANLDQDLPNYAQHSIPIFSLPQEWLWCESWCGNETKAQAKTIDLCNNPKTKEPKLQAARRIVAEWPSLDDEASSFVASLASGAEAAAPERPAAGPAAQSATDDLQHVAREEGQDNSGGPADTAADVEDGHDASEL